MFYGHRFYRLGDHWVFDITDGSGYSIEFDTQGNISNYKQIYKLTKQGVEILTTETNSIPQAVINKSLNILRAYSISTSMV